MRVGEMMERLPPGFGFTSRRRTGSLEAAVEGLGLVSPAAEVLVPEVAAGGTMYRRPLPLPRPLPRVVGVVDAVEDEVVECNRTENLIHGF